jgi:multisubunit Na+/H+ antiporter MnhG subunit
MQRYTQSNANTNAQTLQLNHALVAIVIYAFLHCEHTSAVMHRLCAAAASVAVPHLYC